MTTTVPGTADFTPLRQAELRRNWESLQERVAAAARSVGREPTSLTVVAVTKTWPASDIAALHSLGVTEIGENRAQELVSKIDELPKPVVAAVRWNFIGQLQRNKAAVVARHCAVVHTLDRAELIAPLCRGIGAGERLDVFLQLSLDGDPRRGGLPEAEIAALADRVAEVRELRLAGLMAVPPLGQPPRPAFARLRAASERLQRDHPDAAALSAGMSSDLEEAVMEGATHLRVGTDLMGSRA